MGGFTSRLKSNPGPGCPGCPGCGCPPATTSKDALAVRVPPPPVRLTDALTIYVPGSLNPGAVILFRSPPVIGIGPLCQKIASKGGFVISIWIVPSSPKAVKYSMYTG